MSETTWHRLGAWADKRVARKRAKNLRLPDEYGRKIRARIVREVYWRVEYAMEWPPQMRP